jgi:hypothetical protein
VNAAALEEAGRLEALVEQEADRETQRAAEAAEEAARRDAALGALAGLRSADARLATGETDGVDEELGNAEEALSGRTRVDLEAARAALGQSDLYQAREYIEAALAERRRP